jgi:hypothetical protein
MGHPEFSILEQGLFFLSESLGISPGFASLKGLKQQPGHAFYKTEAVFVSKNGFGL